MLAEGLQTCRGQADSQIEGTRGQIVDTIRTKKKKRLLFPFRHPAESAYATEETQEGR